MNKYYVAGNLNHNGRDYKRGDEITLSQADALPLVNIGVISADEVMAPVTTDTAADTIVVEKKPEPIVGGERSTSGEPSLDGRDAGAATSAAPEKRSFFSNMFSGRKPGVDAPKQVEELGTVPAEMHTITEQDLLDNPVLAAQGLKVGEVVEIGPELTEEEAAKLLAENGGKVEIPAGKEDISATL